MLIQQVQNIKSYDSQAKSLPVSQQASNSYRVGAAADDVQISDAGKILARLDPNTAAVNQGNNWQWLAKQAHSMDDIEADKFVSELSSSSDAILVNLEDYPILRMSRTGQVLTEKDIAYFDTMAESVRQGRLAVYQQEKAKGTAAGVIMDKITAYMTALPEKYQILAGVKTGYF